MDKFHGFYFTRKQDRVVYGLRLSDSLFEAMKEISLGQFFSLPPEEFQGKFARWLSTYTPQGHVAWHGDRYWVIDCGRNLKTEESHVVGVNVIRFRDGELPEFSWFSRNESHAEFATRADIIDPEDDDQVYQLAHVPWDWLISGLGDDHMFPLTQDQLEDLERLEFSR